MKVVGERSTGHMGHMDPLKTRVCRVCDQVKDLNKFVKSKTRLYGRATVCKKCDNTRRRERHLRLVESFGRPIRCYFCREEIAVLEGWSGESLVIHSLDGSHENWDPANKVPAHRKCHSEHHFPIGEDNPNWKGEDAKYRTKRYSRKRYPRGREDNEVPGGI